MQGARERVGQGELEREAESRLCAFLAGHGILNAKSFKSFKFKRAQNRLRCVI